MGDTGNTIGTAYVEIGIELSQLKSGIQECQTSVSNMLGQIASKSNTATATAATQQMSWIDKLQTRWAVYSGAVMGAIEATSQLREMMAMGREALMTEHAFAALTKSIGANGEEMISEMRRVTMQTIDDSDLMAKAIKGISLGMSQGAMQNIAEASVNASIIAQTTVGEAYNRLMDAVSVGNYRILTRMGALGKDTAKALMQAFAAGVAPEDLQDIAAELIVLHARLTDLGDTAMEAAVKHQRLTATIHEAKETIGKGLLEILATVVNVFQLAAAGIEYFIGCWFGLVSRLQPIINLICNAVRSIVDAVQWVVQAIAPYFDWLVQKISSAWQWLVAMKNSVMAPIAVDKTSGYEVPNENDQKAQEWRSKGAAAAQKSWDDLSGQSDKNVARINNMSKEEAKARETALKKQLDQLKKGTKQEDEEWNLRVALWNKYCDELAKMIYDEIELLDWQKETELDQAKEINASEEEKALIVEVFERKKNEVRAKMALENAKIESDFNKKMKDEADKAADAANQAWKALLAVRDENTISLLKYSVQLGKVTELDSIEIEAQTKINAQYREAIVLREKLKDMDEYAGTENLFFGTQEQMDAMTKQAEAFEKIKNIRDEADMQKQVKEQEMQMKMVETQNKQALANLEMQKKMYTITPVDAIKAEINANSSLLAVYQERLRTMTPGNENYILQEEKINDLLLKQSDLYAQLQQQTGDFFEGVDFGFRKMESEMQTSFQLGAGFAKDFHTAVKDSFSTLFKDIRSGDLKSFEDYFSDFCGKLADIFTNMLSTMLANYITSGIANMFGMGFAGGGFMGGMPEGSAISGMDIAGEEGMSFFSPSEFGLFHGGGIVGRSGGAMRALSSALLLGATRLHGGLYQGEYPAILKKGETVYPEGQDPGRQRPPIVNVNIENKTGADVRKRESNATYDNGLRTWVKSCSIELAGNDLEYQSAHRMR